MSRKGDKKKWDEYVEKKTSHMASKMPMKVTSDMGQEQVGRVMEEFHAGKLRAKSGKKVSNVKQAKAIALSEGRTVQKRGAKKRTWKGKTRIRPILKKK